MTLSNNALRRLDRQRQKEYRAQRRIDQQYEAMRRDRKPMAQWTQADLEHVLDHMENGGYPPRASKPSGASAKRESEQP